ncbi:MAG: NUDIX hydrolase [uncultured bacterium]|nr:MAG: NUDIX hydrolase [uncultured bacterium]
MKKWKVIRETDVSPSKWFPVLQQTVELPNGKIVDDYFISPLGNVVMVLPITTKNEVVLVKQYKHAVGEILIELPAGFQQKGKTLEESALAELEEEVGIKTTVGNLISIGKNANNPTKTTNVTYCYLAKNLEFNSKQNFDTNEEIEIVKVSPQEALEMIKKGEIWVADSVAAITRALLLYPELFK